MKMDNIDLRNLMFLSRQFVNLWNISQFMTSAFKF